VFAEYEKLKSGASDVPEVIDAQRKPLLNTSATHRFGLSSMKIIAFIVVMAIMGWHCGSIVFGYDKPQYRPEWAYLISSITLPICIAGIILATFALIKTPKALLTINPQGVRDLHVSSEVIPWNWIDSVETREIDRIWRILLRVTPASQIPLAPYYKGFSGDYEPSTDTRTITISQVALNVDRIYLEGLLRKYRDAYGSAKDR
jgi:hypothetical protein